MTNTVKTILSPGRYWIGDPSFLFQGKRGKKKWQTIINKTNFFSTPLYQDDTFNFWASDTGLGEGLFYSNTDEPIIVESGILGIIPLDQVIAPLYIQTDLHKRGIVVLFDSDVDVEKDEGIFRFGHVVIDTSETNVETFEELI